MSFGLNESVLPLIVLSALTDRPRSMWDTRIPVPDVPVVPALSLLFVHAVLRTTASVRTSIAVPTSLFLYIASLPVMVRALRDLEFLAWIDQIRILDEV